MDASDATTILSGLGLFLLGIQHLTEWLKGFAGDGLRRGLQTLVRGRFSAVLFGAVFTALIQSSSATVLTIVGVVVALHAGSLSLHRACAMIVGQSIGTAATRATLGAIGGGPAVRRAASPGIHSI